MIKKVGDRMLNRIKHPKDLKSLTFKELNSLAQDIRNVLINYTAQNGGHLAPNLGAVDLILALHYSYNSPKDKLVFDVGHQAYTHKLITGRYDKFHTMRKIGGLSGYLKLAESEHDAYGGGHVGTAVSAALGMAEGRDLKKEEFNVVAIVGDGSLTNGLTFEGMNNIGERGTNITIVLNDNKWSISKNIGGIAKYLERLSAVHIAENQKTDFESIFRALGFTYFGPVDGHDIEKLADLFKVAKETPGPKIVHVLTKKGYGYEFSEKSPDKFHFTNPFVLESGKTEKDTKNLTYSEAFGKALIKIAKTDKKIVGITAAMPSGTGLEAYAKEYPDRFFDVGIAESHAVTFAAGLALQGFKPVVAIYSSFLQRAYDQIMQDVCLQNLPVIFAIDRAGIVGSDGPTHHGLFDLSYLRSVPNLKVLSPKDENELEQMIYTATQVNNGPIAIRYPRGIGMGVSISRKLQKVKITEAEEIIQGDDAAILAVGSMVYPSIEAAKKLSEKGIFVSVYNARSIKPIDQKMIKNAAQKGNILTVEENVLEGGFGSAVLEELEKAGITGVKVKRIGVDKFIEHGEISELREKCCLTSENIFNSVWAMTDAKKKYNYKYSKSIMSIDK